MGAAAPMIAAGGQAFSGLGNAYVQSRAARLQGQLEKKSAGLNAQLEDIRARQTVQQGRSEMAKQHRATRMLIGSQRAAGAGSGVRVGTGSLQNITAQSALMGEVDRQTIQTNAYRQAFGYQVAANEARYRGKMAGIAGKGQAKSILLTGGMQAAQAMAGGFGQMQAEQYENRRNIRLYGTDFRS